MAQTVALAVGWGVFAHHVPQWRVVIWSVFLGLGFVGRWWVLRDEPSSEQDLGWRLNALTVLTVVNALLWDAAVFYWYFDVDAPERVVLLMLLGGQAMGSVAAAAHVRSFVADIVLFILPVSTWLIVTGAEGDRYAGLLLLAFGSTMALFGQQSFNAFYDELGVRTEMSVLVARLQRANAVIVERMKEEARVQQELRSSVGLSWSSRAPVQINQLVGDAMARLQRQYKAPVEVWWNAPSNDMFVLADPQQVNVALGALVGNAVEALGGAGGHVRIALRRVDRGIHAPNRGVRTNVAPGAYAELSIHDDGEGMDAATLARTLDPFFTTRGLGRGIGLCIVANIAGMHGGGLELDSTVGAGTTAYLLLPIVR